MDIQANYMDTPERRVLDLRRDGLADVPLIGRSAYVHDRSDLPLHRHFGVVEIVYMVRGTQCFAVGHERYRVRGNELFVAFPDEPHSTGGYPMEPNLFYWLNVRLPKPNRTLLGMPKTESVQLVRSLCQLRRRYYRGNDRIRSLFDSLLQMHDSPQMRLRTIRMRQALVELLLEVIDCAAFHVDSESSGRMTTIILKIESQPEEDFRLEELAKQADLSLSRFKARFRAETGTPPIAHQSTYRSYQLQPDLTFRERLVLARRAASCVVLRVGPIRMVPHRHAQSCPARCRWFASR